MKKTIIILTIICLSLFILSCQPEIGPGKATTGVTPEFVKVIQCYNHQSYYNTPVTVDDHKVLESYELAWTNYDHLEDYECSRDHNAPATCGFVRQFYALRNPVPGYNTVMLGNTERSEDFAGHTYHDVMPQKDKGEKVAYLLAEPVEGYTIPIYKCTTDGIAHGNYDSAVDTDPNCHEDTGYCHYKNEGLLGYALKKLELPPLSEMPASLAYGTEEEGEEEEPLTGTGKYLYACVRRKGFDNMRFDDYYVVATNSPSQNPCPEGATTSIIGILGTSGGTKLVQCTQREGATARDQFISLDGCEAGADKSAELGHVATKQEEGLIPATACKHTANNEKFVAYGNGCPEGANKLFTFYVKPFCTEEDEGRDYLTQGNTYSYIEDETYTDSCENKEELREYYCDHKKIPYGVNSEEVTCPKGAECHGGICVTYAESTAAEPGEELPAATVPLYQCRRTSAANMHDYYVSLTYPCPVGETLGILGRIYDYSEPQPENTVLLKYCYTGSSAEPNDDHFIAINKCDTNTQDQANTPNLGWVYTEQQADIDTIPLYRCKFDANGEHTQTSITPCPDKSDEEGKWYILPFCKDSDDGKNILTHGTTTGLIEQYPKTEEDSCMSPTSVEETYCDPTALPHGVKEEVIQCPEDSVCQDGACVVEQEEAWLWSCRDDSDVGNLIYDHYVVAPTGDYNYNYACGAGELIAKDLTQRIIGKVFKVQKEGTQRLTLCEDSSNYNDREVILGDCPTGTNKVKDIGFVYPTKEDGTVPATECRFTANSEKFVINGDGCPEKSDKIFTFYVMPFCTETDDGKDPYTKGNTYSVIEDETYSDSCENKEELREYYCDPTKIPYGVNQEEITCPEKTECKEGACETEINIKFKKDLLNYESRSQKAYYGIEAVNVGEKIGEEDLVVITDLLPAGLIFKEAKPEPTSTKQVNGRTELTWEITEFGDREREDYKQSEETNQYASEGIFKIEIITDVNAASGIKIKNTAKLTYQSTELEWSADEFEAEGTPLTRLLYRCYNTQRWDQKQLLDHYVSFDPNCDGNSVDGPIGNIYSGAYKDAEPDLEAIYQCTRTTDHSGHTWTDHFLSKDSNCEGQNYESLVGNLPSKSSDKTTTYYRCLGTEEKGGFDHMVSSALNCEGYNNEGLMFYFLKEPVMQEPTPARARPGDPCTTDADCQEEELYCMAGYCSERTPLYNCYLESKDEYYPSDRPDCIHPITKEKGTGKLIAYMPSHEIEGTEKWGLCIDEKNYPIPIFYPAIDATCTDFNLDLKDVGRIFEKEKEGTTELYARAGPPTQIDRFTEITYKYYYTTDKEDRGPDDYTSGFIPGYVIPLAEEEPEEIKLIPLYYCSYTIPNSPFPPIYYPSIYEDCTYPGTTAKGTKVKQLGLVMEEQATGTSPINLCTGAGNPAVTQFQSCGETLTEHTQGYLYDQKIYDTAIELKLCSYTLQMPPGFPGPKVVYLTQVSTDTCPQEFTEIDTGYIFPIPEPKEEDCGNGVVDAGEECDDAAPDPTADCTEAEYGNYWFGSCTAGTCENCECKGTLDCSGATCAVGSADYCAYCPHCGDHNVNCGEECDPPDGTTCDSQCRNITPTITPLPPRVPPLVPPPVPPPTLPPFPHQFYGNVINGIVGMPILATLSSTNFNTIADSNIQYGYSPIFLVTGTTDGALISFYVNESFDQTYAFQQGALTQLDLTYTPGGEPPAGPTCSDGIKNQDETDIDCGGTVCPKCANNKNCTINKDCKSNYCKNKVCKKKPVTRISGGGGGGGGGRGMYTAAEQFYGTAQPTDGGAAECMDDWICDPWGPCIDGMQTRDCFLNDYPECILELPKPDTTQSCEMPEPEYVPPAAPTCFDGIQNQDETFPDCGGSMCKPCDPNLPCIMDRDCVTGYCDPITQLCSWPPVIEEPKPPSLWWVWLIVALAAIGVIGGTIAAVILLKKKGAAPAGNHRLKDLKEYVDKYKKKGIPEEKIRKKVLEHGWKKDVVDKVLK